MVENYLNNKEGETRAELIRKTDSLYGESPSDDWYKNMKQARKPVLSSSTRTAPAIINFCKHINSAPPNLRLDDTYLNSSIGGQSDPKLVRTDSGNQWEMSPNTHWSMQDEDYADLDLSPGRTTFNSSSAGESVPISDLTDETQDALGL